jgi:hypothetical protein
LKDLLASIDEAHVLGENIFLFELLNPILSNNCVKKGMSVTCCGAG